MGSLLLIPTIRAPLILICCVENAVKAISSHHAHTHTHTHTHTHMHIHTPYKQYVCRSMDALTGMRHSLCIGRFSHPHTNKSSRRQVRVCVCASARVCVCVCVWWMRRRWISIEVWSTDDHCCEWAPRWWWLDRERQSSWAQDWYLKPTVGEKQANTRWHSCRGFGCCCWLISSLNLLRGNSLKTY